MKSIRLGLVCAVFCAPAAVAQQTTSVTQTGDDNIAEIKQLESTNSLAVTNQSGVGDLANINQLGGGGNAGSITQTGDAPDEALAVITQSGGSNTRGVIEQNNGGAAGIIQFSQTDSTARINQTGDNIAGVLQRIFPLSDGQGINNSVSITQSGGTPQNSVEVVQSGENNLFRAVQSGSGNTIRGDANQFGQGTVTQTGSAGNRGVVNQGGLNNVADLDQTAFSNPNALNVVQSGTGGTVTITQSN